MLEFLSRPHKKVYTNVACA